jgi:alkylation response protein AidB-like acyl-CoA dehydrogenase
MWLMVIPDVPASEETRGLQETLRRFLGRHLADGALTQIVEKGVPDLALWTALDAQVGVAGIAAPADFGGAGADATVLAAAQREFGRTLAPVPFLTTSVLAVALLAAVDSPVAAEHLTRVAAGELVMAVSVLGAAGNPEPHDTDVTAVAHGDRWVLSGRCPYVMDGLAGQCLVTLARTEDGPAAFIVDAAAAGVQRDRLRTLDLTREQAAITLVEAPAHMLAPASVAEAIWSRMLQVGWLCLVSEQVGGAERLVAMAVDYAKTREQFGRPIGSFQAVKHKLADMAVDLELMKSAEWQLLASRTNASADERERRLAAHVAAAFCSDAYFRIAAQTVQVHGGIGFTWEHPAHLYFRRAKSSSMVLGTSQWHRARLFDLAAGPTA